MVHTNGNPHDLITDRIFREYAEACAAREALGLPVPIRLTSITHRPGHLARAVTNALTFLGNMLASPEFSSLTPLMQTEVQRAYLYCERCFEGFEDRTEEESKKASEFVRQWFTNLGAGE